METYYSFHIKFNIKKLFDHVFVYLNFFTMGINLQQSLYNEQNKFHTSLIKKNLYIVPQYL